LVQKALSLEARQLTWCLQKQLQLVAAWWQGGWQLRSNLLVLLDLGSLGRLWQQAGELWLGGLQVGPQHPPW
jgi:hypothetical protein